METILVTVWVIAIHATVISTGGVVGASSIPDHWPTKEACDIEAAKALEYIAKTRPDLGDLKVICVPHRKLVEAPGGGK